MKRFPADGADYRRKQTKQNLRKSARSAGKKARSAGNK
jgi:hypothetical protein